jgi:hypothetical protein
LTANRIASIHARLLTRAKARGEQFELTLTRFGVERFLYRLSISEVCDRYWLKGALLFDLWFAVPHRPTRDADFLGFGEPDVEIVRREIASVCQIAVDDGIVFDPSSIVVEEIREGASYGGLRARLIGRLGAARCHVQLDIGYGDAVTPGPEQIDYPALLDDMPTARLRAYPRASVVAEKLEAIVTLGFANSRMKDYFDLRALACEGAIDPAALGRAIRATFERRGTTLPEDFPLGLSDEFARDTGKVAQWRAFLAKSRLDAPSLVDVVAEVRAFLAQPLSVARQRGEP